MLTHAVVITGKELIDAIRDVRPLISSAFYCLMGPGIVFMVSMAMNGRGQDRAGGSVLIGMISVFILVSAFLGGMNVAMDALAGERERKSLLPLLMNGVAPRDVVLGKWLAVTCFSTAGLTINLTAFLFVLSRAHVPIRSAIAGSAPMLAAGLIPLALLAAAAELGISTACRSVKEAHTYLSMLVFLPMGTGMLLVFFPSVTHGWWRLVPIIGQQWQLEHWVRGDLSASQAAILGLVTAVLTGLILWGTASLLGRDDVVYGRY